MKEGAEGRKRAIVVPYMVTTVSDGRAPGGGVASRDRAAPMYGVIDETGMGEKGHKGRHGLLLRFK